MIANGLTKALLKTEFNKFLRQVNLVNIASKITNREAKENKQEELTHNTLSIYMGDFDWGSEQPYEQGSAALQRLKISLIYDFHQLCLHGFS